MPKVYQDRINRTLRQGHTGSDVRTLQYLLNDSGNSARWTWDLYPGKIDGDFGPLTAKAVKRAKYWLGCSRPDSVADLKFVEYLTGKRPLLSQMHALRKSRIAKAKSVKKAAASPAPKIVKHNWDWRYQPSRLQPPKGIVLHNTGAAKSSAEGIHAYHKSIGWAGIGYNFLVMIDGTIHEGRGEHLAGAHAMGVNSRTFGVAAEGNYDREKTMPQAQFDAIVSLCRWLDRRHPGMYLVGHRQVPGNSTSCPGRYYPLSRIKAAVG